MPATYAGETIADFSHLEGKRARLTQPVGDYPIRTVPAGEEGTLHWHEEGDGIAFLGLTLDRIFEDLEEWNNELYVTEFTVDPMAHLEILS